MPMAHILLFRIAHIVVAHDPIAYLPKRCRSCRSMWIEVLVEPRADDAPLRSQPTNLHAFAAPSLFSAVASQ